MQTMITIEHAFNGFIVTDTDAEGNQKQVFQETVDGDIKHVELMLWHILESVGYYGSKHDAERIRISIEKKGE